MSDDFEELEKLLSQSLAHTNRMRRAAEESKSAKSRTEVSQDYAERLAEKAVFRRLLSDEALDGIRFRFLFQKGIPHVWAMWVEQPGFSLDLFRKYLDAQIVEEERKRG